MRCKYGEPGSKGIPENHPSAHGTVSSHPCLMVLHYFARKPLPLGNMTNING